MPLNLKVGDSFPDVELTDHSNRSVSLKEIVGGRPLMLAFYRGHW
ncbi:MAG: redoxin domain-containing protein [SAR324 cluster bacterium]|nr:redoxin domain-containing protein [SAR324 cluster bacterium]